MAIPFQFPNKNNSDPHLVNLLFQLYKFLTIIFVLLSEELDILFRYLFLLSHINKLYKFLKELVECNICFETQTARTKIRQCVNGHLICNYCYTEYNRLRSRDFLSETLDSRHQPCCPVCRTTDIGIRSVLAEKLVAKLTENEDFQESDISQN